jgi:hypothetical protein
MDAHVYCPLSRDGRTHTVTCRLCGSPVQPTLVFGRPVVRRKRYCDEYCRTKFSEVYQQPRGRAMTPAAERGHSRAVESGDRRSECGALGGLVGAG